MAAFLNKFKTSAWLPILKRYFTWLAFTSVLFILTHVFSALNLIQAYRFRFLDIFFTYGFLVFLGFLESAFLALLITALHWGIQKLFHKDPAPVFRLLVIAWFSLSWINLVLALFNKSLFS